ncbi:MAG: DNA topoisomerase VI subunit B [Verrucomicrobia bacterium]|nr:DNA topoisomerase VI subunit B [Verrucomicrobiota bacterium]MBU4291221.1 DNA topoisomerase VI subunit B [Verrucomicrobiota bacterium]MBU4430007.1 DNA topoisomerase VI subunit B [Verrucomicrobiota bacterium]MCG2678621.1 DNA topoisomerase VI subunit B [Kiritimatiellia bacterium]
MTGNMANANKSTATAESLAKLQRDISVSEFFLKNRHLLGFDNPRKALLTAVKEAVDNSLDACDESGILPEISVDIRQTGDKRFCVAITDNGPGIVRNQVPKIFAKLLYGSKFHRLRMSRGQQGIGISAAGMYGQLTTGTSTVIQSKIKTSKKAHLIEVQIDTRANKPTILKDDELDWFPQFFPTDANGKPKQPITARHGTSVTIEMEAAYIRGKLSVDEYLKQCAIVNPHLQLHYRIRLSGPAPDEDSETSTRKAVPAKTAAGKGDATSAAPQATKSPPLPQPSDEVPWITFARAATTLPKQPTEIKPHPHGIELGILMQMLKDTQGKTLKSALVHDFSRVSDRAAVEIAQRAGLDPKSRPTHIAHRESEALFKAINETKLMRPPTDCLSPIGEEAIMAGLKKEIEADFYTAITRGPEVYRGNPFQIEAGLAYAKPGANADLNAEEPVRILRFANKVPLLYMGGACAINKAITGVNWKSYGLTHPRGSLPVGPMVILVHMASVWVPFTSESKEAIAHYPEIIRETTFALQECGRRLSVYLSRRRRQAEMERKKNYIELYLPHLALGLRQILDLDDRQEKTIISKLHRMLERTHLEE